MDQNKFHNDYVMNINKMFEDPKYVDVYLTYPDGNERIPSIRALLASQSPYFYNRFYGELSDGNDMILTLNELNYNTFKIFKFLHICIFGFAIDFSVLSAEDQFEMFEQSVFYQFDIVRNSLFDHLCNVTHENCWTLFKFAIKRNDKSFASSADFCPQFISQNIQNLADNPNFLGLDLYSLTSLLTHDTFYLPEEEIYSAVLKW
jgi:hypothetical protein